jgi:hypothetical protein
MDIKQLLEKMDQFAGQAVGQKPGDQWRGTDSAPPGKKLVGDSMLKDLSKGKKAKSKEQELSEEFQAFLEAEFKDTVVKRPARKNARHSRGHEPQPRYKTVKADEDANTDNKLAKLLTRFINQNEGAGHAVASDAIEYIKKIGHIEQFATSLDYFAVDLDEGWESGPEEYEEPYDDADDAYDRQRQEKIDTEAEKEWAKLPKVSTYKLIGRGPNMEPNYEFGDEFDTLEQALEYRAEIMKDPKTPHPEHIGIRTLTRVKDQTNEAVDSDIVQAMGQDSFNRAGYNPIRDERDYLDTLSKLKNLELKSGINQQMKDYIKQRILDLNAEARKKGYTQVESRGHKILATKLKDVERAKKFASGELKIPTPQERQAQLAKQQPKKEKVDEYGADNPAQATTQKASPAQAQQVAANLNIQKTALGQLKQLNPEIDPQKAAMAATKDVATMSPQEKEELAQVAKTLSPALGTPALGSIKTAIQKSQLQAKK